MSIPFQTIDWSTVPAETFPGETGETIWRTLRFGGLRVRMVEYSAGYIADHWCQLGHVVHCLEGSFITEMESGERFMLEKGMSYIVSDGKSSHRSMSEHGVTLMIIDGDFLK
jgi:hypothetical protein